MTYAGWNPSYRAFQQSAYIASGGETTITIKANPESVVFKDGKLLTPDGIDYTVNYTTGLVTLTTAATAGNVYQVLNLSTYHVSDTYTRSQADTVFLISTFGTSTNAVPYSITTVGTTMIDMDCSAGSAFATLPQTPKKGLPYHFRDKSGTINLIRKFTVKRYGGTGTIMGINEDMDITTPKASFSMVWNGSDWRVY